jgi:branched-chain amino acid transport system substrate-binding protein
VRQHNKRVMVAAAVTICVGVATAACGGSDTSASANAGTGGHCAITLGTLGPLNGPAANFGQSIKDVTDYVAYTANQAGGLKVGDKQCKVTVEAYDTGYTSAGAASGANDFAAKGIKFVIGPIGAVELLGMKPVAGRQKMLLLHNGLGIHDLEPKYPLNFHISPGPFVWSQPIVRKAKEIYGFKSATIIGPSDTSGMDTIKINQKAFEAEGVKTSVETYQRGISDFSSLVQRILRTGSDVVDLAGSPAGDAGIVVKELRQAGFKGSLARLGGESTAEIARVAGGLEALGDFWYFSQVDPDDAATKELAADYKKALGHEPTSLTLGWTPGARAFVSAMARAGTLDGTEKVAEEMRKETLNDPTFGQGTWTGQEQFGINQELSFPFYMGHIKDGQYQPFTRLTADS